MGEILIPVLVLSVIAIVCAVILTLSAIFFSVPTDETTEKIRECLPGANCGACGYSGCDGYAAALGSKKETRTNLCTPGADKTAAEIAAVLGVQAEDVVEKIAYVACSGTCDIVQKRFDYQGHKSCLTANLNYSGDRLCTYACLGYGDCAKVCPQDAIDIVDGIAKVNTAKCIGCGICAKACPNHIIHIINQTSKVTVSCSNHDKGAVTRKACTVGCIACGKCVKTCPKGAISLVDNLATIDYEKCTGCGACVEACPVKCIKNVVIDCGK